MRQRTGRGSCYKFNSLSDSRTNERSVESSHLVNSRKFKNEGSDKLSCKISFGDVILNTYASHYITGKLSLMVDPKSISPCTMGFADGSKTFAMSMGVFPLTDIFSLTNVLYLPSLN